MRCVINIDLNFALSRNNVHVEMAAFYRTLECAGKELRIKQLYVGDVGCVVWDAALVLARFLENSRHFGNFWCGKSTLELGSGTGVVGLAACVLGQVND